MNEYQYDLMDRYFQKALSPEEISAFRSDLQSDAELREAFALRRLTAAALHRSNVQAFKKKTLAAQQPQRTKSAVMRRIRPLYWAIAASFALLLAALAWWWQTGVSSDRSQALFALYDVKGLYPETQYALVNEGQHHKGITGSQALHGLKVKGLEAYEVKDWDTAINTLTEYLAKAKPSEEDLPDEINLMNLYVGRAWLEKGDETKAIVALQKAIDGVVDKVNYGMLEELMRWQLTLAHLKNNEPQAAKKTALQLLEAQHPTIQQQAKQLLNDLK